MIICSKCKQLKSDDKFPSQKKKTNNKSSWCKLCVSKKALAYKRTKRGLILTMYNSQIANSKKRKMMIPSYSKDWLINSFINDSKFNEMYLSWIENDFNIDFKPSFDRLDDTISYTKDNIQVLTWKENREKSVISVFSKPKGVIQLNKDKKIINVFCSTKDASEKTNISKSSITGCCSKSRNSAGGFLWSWSSCRI